MAVGFATDAQQRCDQQVVGLPRRILADSLGFGLFSRVGSEGTSVFFSVAGRIHDAPVVSCRMKRRITANTQPTRTATGKTYRIAGMPMRNISIHPMVKIAPAIPPPIRSFALLICGVGVSSFIVRLLTTSIPPFPPPLAIRSVGKSRPTALLEHDPKCWGIGGGTGVRSQMELRHLEP